MPNHSAPTRGLAIHPANLLPARPDNAPMCRVMNFWKEFRHDALAAVELLGLVAECAPILDALVDGAPLPDDLAARAVVVRSNIAPWVGRRVAAPWTSIGDCRGLVADELPGAEEIPTFVLEATASGAPLTPAASITPSALAILRQELRDAILEGEAAQRQLALARRDAEAAHEALREANEQRLKMIEFVDGLKQKLAALTTPPPSAGASRG